MHHKLLVANRGEIALRIMRTARAEGIATVAIYTSSDALSPHVTAADEAIFLGPQSSDDKSPEAESQAYLSGPRIVSLAQEHGVTMLHPGYGFLSENAEFAQAVLDAGIVWLGPRPSVIKLMGLKHLAREVAREANVVCVPGSEGLMEDETTTIQIANRIGFPVMLKASAGGGGMGMVICDNEDALVDAFSRVKKRAEFLFNDGGVFLEHYFPSARHIEIQIFGNGVGDVVCMGERECSIQRRHQKIIEETPSPFLETQLRVEMCEAATRLASFVKYGSAGTVEFLVDNETSEFFFLEMNTRIQGVAELAGSPGLATTSVEMQQTTYDSLLENGRKLGSSHSIEARIYAENPAEEFRPCPGVLQHVNIPNREHDWLRVETWISTGTTITPFFDPLLCKIVVSAPNRIEAISRLRDVLEQSQIQGATNNMEYLKEILDNATFRSGGATTRSMTVLAAAIETTVQDFPGRTTRLGIPRSGPLDSISFRAADILVGNPMGMEGLEMIVLPGSPSTFQFHVAAVVAVTGKDVLVNVNGQEADIWSRIIVPAGGKLSLSAKPVATTGLRTYLAVRGGFPFVPKYLGSKSTSFGLGGFQGRSLIAGDEIALAKDCGPTETDSTCAKSVPPAHVPVFPSHFVIHVLSGPHDDQEYVTSDGISKFYATRWRVSPSSNRLGIRLENADKIIWARENGGAGGSHPSNILDNGYTLGALNINGDTPVILVNEGPDMGGYVCLCTVVSGEMWKLGQLSAGCTIEFRRVSWADAMLLHAGNTRWLRAIQDNDPMPSYDLQVEYQDQSQDPKLYIIPQRNKTPLVVLRQAGDSAILVEYGEMRVDFNIRARLHAFQTVLNAFEVPGILALCPCIRSTMCHFDPSVVSQSDVLAAILKAEEVIPDSKEMLFPGRRLTFPIVLDDQWSREALKRYMNSTRDKAVYLPSNVEYLARNNGFESSEEVLNKLVASDWLVFGVGFYLACPFLIPIDPRCRLVAQKMNPSRTYTPRGAVGIAGVVAAIYPIVSPGGYQLYGRTLPAWQEWGKGPGFAPDRPWLLQPFDQVHFEPVTESQYIQIENEFDAGRYVFEIEETTFSMAEYSVFSASIADQVSEFEVRQAESVAREETKEKRLLEEWELEKITKAKAGQGSMQITSPLFGNVWKICCHPGDIITSAETTVAILEAMKTEIPVKAGDVNVGKTVTGLGKGIHESATVRPGDVLLVLV
ncbi:allophanate hydrolase subunit 2-domain-containing protein [Mycena galericulata]|nr:allophanate hydrolase subunit 2-domain-containing protein [Mycena galericulata]